VFELKASQTRVQHQGLPKQVQGRDGQAARWHATRPHPNHQFPRDAASHNLNLSENLLENAERFIDFCIGWQREVETDVKATFAVAAVGMERLARREDDALSRRFRQQIARPQPILQPTPEIEPTIRTARGEGRSMPGAAIGCCSSLRST